MVSDEEAMLLAIEEGKKSLGFVSPNPPVGCVVVSKEKKIISKGFHRNFGGDHAEIDAIKGIDPEDLDGAEVFCFT